MASRGGRRQGRVGGGYTNRTDLMSAAKPLPPKTAPGQPYGQGVELEGAQRAVPMAPPPTATPPAAGPALAAPSPADHWLAPTARPAEPVTAGLPTGPGPGPEVLSTTPQQSRPLVQAVALLNALGTNVGADTTRMRDALSASLSNQTAP